MNIREVIDQALRERQFIVDPTWLSHGYTYKFVPNPFGDEYYIRAGCRTFNTFEEFRHHYSRSWNRRQGCVYTLLAQTREMYRIESLEIAREMEAFAVEYGVPVKGAGTKPKKRTTTKSKTKVRKKR